MSQKRITSIELAKLAGVSTATISRAFSANSSISPGTRNRILRIARENSYQPNAIARSLNKSETGMVAIVVNTIGNPSEAHILDNLVPMLQEIGKIPLLVSCGNSEGRHQLVEFASTYQVDHAIIFSDLIAAKTAYEIFHRISPIIATSEPVTDPKMKSIHLDGSDGAREIVDALVAKGRQNFAYIHGRTTSWIDRQRQDWFEQALAGHGLEFVAEGSGDYTYESGYKETVMLLRRNKVDALICSNDVMAIGAIDAARNVLGRDVPNDLAVVGQDGVPLASWECHQLTTLACDQAKVSKQVIAMINGKAPPPPKPNTYDKFASVAWGSTT